MTKSPTTPRVILVHLLGRIMLLVCSVAWLVAATESNAQNGRTRQSDRADAAVDEKKTTPHQISTRLKQTGAQKRKSLESVKKVDDHPLYVMEYHGDYDCLSPQKKLSQLSDRQEPRWACSLFVAFGNRDLPLFGRNFDWQYNPAVLLFSDPSDGYASLSMVDVSYLGYDRQDKKFRSLAGRENLLPAVMIPFDGMNEHGLTVGMAAVPTVKTPKDAEKPSVGSLQIIRIILNYAKTVDEALALIKKHNINFSGGPQIHYLIADASGQSAVVELKNGKTHIIRTEAKWNSATNFHLTGNEGNENRLCRRYAQIQNLMKQKQGKISIDEAFRLLKNVSQKSTRWSVVFDIKNRTAHVALSRNFKKQMKYRVRNLDKKQD